MIVKSRVSYLFKTPLLPTGLAVLLTSSALTLWATNTPPAPATSAPTTDSSQPTTKTREQRHEEDINRVMEFFRVTQPDVFEKAKALRESDPAKFDKLIRGAVGNCECRNTVLSIFLRLSSSGYLCTENF